MIKFKVGKSGNMPTLGTDGAAGFDLYYSGDDFYFMAHSRAVFTTGVHVAIPEGYVGLVRPRSGFAFKGGIDTMAGVIDSDYRGEIKILLINHGIGMRINKKDRIAQLVVVPCLTDAVQVDSLDNTDRGDGGFGSTGV